MKGFGAELRCLWAQRCCLLFLLVAPVTTTLIAATRNEKIAVGQKKNGPAEFSFFPSRPVVYNKIDSLRLPVSNSYGFFIEYYHGAGLLSNADVGGFSDSEEQRISKYGESIYWQRFYVNGHDISHPLKPGLPLFSFSNKFWDKMLLRAASNSFLAKNGLEWVLDSKKNAADTDEKRTYELFAAHMNNLGGESFMPEKTLDREPAQDWGAPNKRRKFLPSFDLAKIATP